MLNTARSSLNFFRSTLRRFSPIKTKDTSVENILNYLNYNDNLSSSGQPTRKQFTLIAQAGYTLVINLATQDKIEVPLKHEDKIVTHMGMAYAHIPVDFFNPDPHDFHRFVRTMKDAPHEKIWVHCMMNARASAFVYKYRCTVLGENPEKAIWDLRQIWEPFGVWKTFVYGTTADTIMRPASKKGLT